jgi:hypothetical protein
VTARDGSRIGRGRRRDRLGELAFEGGAIRHQRHALEVRRRSRVVRQREQHARDAAPGHARARRDVDAARVKGADGRRDGIAQGAQVVAGAEGHGYGSLPAEQSHAGALVVQEHDLPRRHLAPIARQALHRGVRGLEGDRRGGQTEVEQGRERA